MKVSIIGASGKVGLETTRLLAEQDTFSEHINVVLYSPNNAKKIIGYMQDLEESLLIRNKPFAQNINFLPTSDIHSIQNSDLIIVSAGLFATQKEKDAQSIHDI